MPFSSSLWWVDALLAIALIIVLFIIWYVSTPDTKYKKIVTRCCTGVVHGTMMGGLMNGAGGALRMALILALISPINVIVDDWIGR